MSFREVTRGLARKQISIENLYFLGRVGEPWILVDAGSPMGPKAVVKAARQRYGPNARPQCIFLTHGHFDHAGNAPKLADYWDVPVYAHRLEFPYLTGKTGYPPPDPTVGGAMAQMSRLMPARTANVGDRLREIPNDGSVPHAPEWKWLHTPGHTPGHVSLWCEENRVLIAGDAIITVNQASYSGMVTQRREICGPPSYYTSDWAMARISIELLAELRPLIVASGHGKPMCGYNVADELARFARTFRPPSYGRYVAQAAVQDESGIRYLPPPVPDRVLHKAAAVAVGLAGTAIYLRRRSAH